jgi:hypothetical protein
MRQESAGQDEGQGQPAEAVGDRLGLLAGSGVRGEVAEDEAGLLTWEDTELQ